jgi:hypothetical protein
LVLSLGWWSERERRRGKESEDEKTTPPRRNRRIGKVWRSYGVTPAAREEWPRASRDGNLGRARCVYRALNSVAWCARAGYTALEWDGTRTRYQELLCRSIDDRGGPRCGGVGGGCLCTCSGAIVLKGGEVGRRASLQLGAWLLVIEQRRWGWVSAEVQRRCCAKVRGDWLLVASSCHHHSITGPSSSTSCFSLPFLWSMVTSISTSACHHSCSRFHL